MQRLRKAASLINAKNRAFAIVIIAGLAVGALGGTLLVNQQPPHVDEASGLAERVTEAAEDSQTASESNVAPVGVMAVTENKVRPQRRYRRVRMPARPRAYQVAVIR